MGGGQSKKYLSESELSNVESDSEWFGDSTKPVQATFREMQPNTVEESGDRTDAAIRNVLRPNADHLITVQKVKDIETELDNYEIVSLVYLLYDTCELALQDLELLVVSGENPELLYRWAKSEDLMHKRWQEKLVEALCIIQNYQILKKIGYSKDDLKVRYMPHRAETSCFINKTRKAFYLIAEKLGKEETRQFIYNMDKKLQENGFTVRANHEDYLELYLLYWEQIDLNIEYIKNTFKVMDLERYNDILNSIIPSENPEVALNMDHEVKPSPKMIKKNPKAKTRRKSTTRDTTYPQPRSIEDYPLTLQARLSGISQECPSEDIDRYMINSDNPGIVLIINQEEFYTELDPQYKDLLHEDNDIMKLETRIGTARDKIKLGQVFHRRGFRIIIKENLPHYDIINTIKDVVMMISFESSLIVCILSHGDNGVVYGANSCKVDVNQIQNIICKKNKKLTGQPKVLILQSCQGKQCQKIEEGTEDEDDENANATDGPGTVPATADLLTFWATIPGYAAIRNVNRGSWLIQELCNEIEQVSSRCHFQDICTRVVNKVTSKEWREETGTNIMTPMVVTTLRKAFYLPLPRNVQ